MTAKHAQTGSGVVSAALGATTAPRGAADGAAGNDHVAAGRLTDFWQARFAEQVECGECPTLPEVTAWFLELLGALFEQHSLRRNADASTFLRMVERLESELATMVRNAGRGTITPAAREQGAPAPYPDVAQHLFANLPAIRSALVEDAEATVNGDPAARGLDEVIRAYPGFVATAAYRVAHELHGRGAELVARMISSAAHRLTGIDIHPAAVIGRRFCIDHGTGVVIGETSILGDDVKLYQGVTLGGVSVSKADAAKKRHPTISDRVVIYSGATILGGETIVGHDSVIGGNVWLTRSVPPFSRLSYRANAVGSEASSGPSLRTATEHEDRK